MTVSKIDHVHLIVKDLDKTLKSFEKILGLKPWAPFGIKDSPAARVAMLCPQDGARIEIIQPKDKNGFMADLLEARGDGIYGVTAVIENYDGEIEKLKRHGVALREQTVTTLFPGYTFRIAWVPPSEGLGFWTELCDAAGLPDFEKHWEATD
jgi:catechol 2,3-dioxygenase-like lactoylglutathione lyase family enzyme